MKELYNTTKHQKFVMKKFYDNHELTTKENGHYESIEQNNTGHQEFEMKKPQRPQRKSDKKHKNHEFTTEEYWYYEGIVHNDTKHQESETTVEPWAENHYLQDVGNHPNWPHIHLLAVRFLGQHLGGYKRPSRGGGGAEAGGASGREAHVLVK